MLFVRNTSLRNLQKKAITIFSTRHVYIIAMKIKKSEIRLLFLSDHLGYSAGVTHGATTYFLNVLPSLKAAGVDLRVCFLRNRHQVAEELEEQGIIPVFLDRGKWDPRALSDLVALVKKYDINLIHAAGMKGILLGRAACRICGCKFVMHLHDTSVPGPLFRFLHRGMAGWTERCLAISEAVGKLARERFGISPERVTVLYNGIDLEKYRNADPDARERVRTELRLPSTAPVLAVIGRLSPEKGQAFILPWLPELLRTHPDARVLIVGEGPTKRECEAILSKNGTSAFVRFTGHRSDIPDILAASDILVIPSLMEGLSFCALEAMAASRPVVAFRVGGIPELIAHDRTGVLAPERDGAALVEQIRRLLDDAPLRASVVAEGQAFVNRFSIHNHIQDLIAIYEDVLRSPARG